MFSDTVYSTDKYNVGSDFLLGNGNILIFGNKSEITEFCPDGGAAPSFLSLYADFGDNYYTKCESFRKASTSTYLHNIYSKSIYKRLLYEENCESEIASTFEDIRITDVLHPKDNIFVRYCENIRPFTLKIMSAPYVKKSFFQNYPLGRRTYQVLSLTMPKGVAFYKNCVSMCETKMLVLVDGDAKFTPDGSEVDVLVGASRVIFVTGSGEECVKNLLKAISDRLGFDDIPEIIKESEEFWNKEFAVTKIADKFEDHELLETAVLNLCAMQRYDGGVLSGLSEPIFSLEGISRAVNAFLSLKMFNRAKSALEFVCKKYRLHGTFYQVYGSSSEDYERYFSNVSLGSARFINAMLDYAEISGDVSFVKVNFDILRKALYDQFKEISCGMMPFSGNECVVTDEIVGPGVQFHGSLEATVTAASSILRLADFCEKNDVKLPHDNGSAVRKGRELLSSLEKYFINGDEVCFNAPIREKFIKKPRFAFGNCDFCRFGLNYSYYGELERSKDGCYLCPSCFRDALLDNYRVPKAEPCFTPMATAVLLYDKVFVDFYGMERSSALLKAAISQRKAQMSVNTSSADACFLSLVKRFGLNEEIPYFENAVKSSAEFGFPRTIYNNTAKAVLDSKSISDIICAVLE